MLFQHQCESEMEYAMAVYIILPNVVLMEEIVQNTMNNIQNAVLKISLE